MLKKSNFFATKIFKRLLIHLVLLIIAVIILFPFFIMLSTAIKSSKEVFADPPRWIPTHFVYQNFVEAWQRETWGRYFFNTFLVTSLIMFGQLLTSSLAAYVLATKNFFGKNLMFLFFIGTMMIPLEIIIVPDYLLLRAFGWIDTYYALIIPFTAHAFGIFLLRQFFLAIPRDLIDAAKIDGYSDLGILINIFLPLSKPALATVGLFSFLLSYNSFMWPLIVTNSSEMRVVQVALASFATGDITMGDPINMIFAGTLFVAAPVLLVFLFAQRYFIQGIATTGLKG